MRARTVPILMVMATALLAGAPGQAAVPDREDAVQTFSLDVYVAVNGSLQNPNVETDPAEPLYNEFGAPMGVSWDEWDAATATSKAKPVGGSSHPSTDFKIRLTGLVPGGIYSVFYGTFGPDSENPLCPGVERTLGLPSHWKHQLPDPYSFVADPLGGADFHGRAEGTLLEASQLFVSVIYHADGETYGDVPNRGEYVTQGPDCRESYGDDAMRHVIVLQKWS